MLDLGVALGPPAQATQPSYVTLTPLHVPKPQPNPGTDCGCLRAGMAENCTDSGVCCKTSRLEASRP